MAHRVGVSTREHSVSDRRNDSSIANFEVALPPVGLALPCKGTIFRAVPELMLLDEVDTQNERLI